MNDSEPKLTRDQAREIVVNLAYHGIEISKPTLAALWAVSEPDDEFWEACRKVIHAASILAGVELNRQWLAVYGVH